MIDELAHIVDSLKAGRAVDRVSVRTFLGWFFAQRRTSSTVFYIRMKLREAGLVTVPDFESIYLDARIGFRLATGTKEEEEAPDTADMHAVDEPLVLDSTSPPPEPVINWVNRDPSYRISKLAAANSGVTSIKRDASLSEAATLMMARDFSQLPVMTGERDVQGIISWKSIGSRLALGYGADVVTKLMERAHEVRADISIFEAISLIVQHDYVLVRGEHNKITGIVTASDLSLQFRTLTEPFLLLNEIENLIRNMIGERFTPAELSAACELDTDTDREVDSVADLTFGEYIRLLENPKRWDRLKLAVDRVIFCKDLDRVRRIRNDVVHFDPDGITTEDLDMLRHMTRFLKQLEAMRAG
jgi:predicted transcriptional regulator